MRTPSRKGLAKAAISALLVSSLGFLLSLIDPFQLENQSLRLSNDVAQYVFDPLYGGRSLGRGAIGQGRITVVNIDEQTLHQLAGIWTGYPPSYANQAMLLSDVATGAGAAARPRAIFMDFTFISKGRRPDEFEEFLKTVTGLTKADTIEGDGSKPARADWRTVGACANDEIVKIACILASQGVPVILGGKPADRLAAFDKTEDGLEALSKVAVLSSLFVKEREYPLLATNDANSPAALMYVAERLAGDRPCSSRDPYDRLACATKVLIRGAGSAPLIPNKPYDPTRVAQEAADEIRRTLGGEFSVNWSSNPSLRADTVSHALYGLPSDCPGRQRQGARDAWITAAGRLVSKISPWRFEAWRVGEERGSERPPSPCPYALNLPYGAFATAASLSDPVRRDLFSDKLVLIGGAFQNSNDWVVSPAHGYDGARLPGVQYHAMALDNLLEAQADGHHPPRIDRWTEWIAWLSTAALTFMLMMSSGWRRIARNDLAARFRALAPTARAPRGEAATFLGFYGQFVVLDLALAFGFIFAAIILHVPMNWIAAVLIVLPERIVALVETAVEDVEPLFHDWPIARDIRWALQRLSLRDEILHPPPPPPPPAAPPQEDPAT